MEKTPEYWAALVGMVIYLGAQKLEGENVFRRWAKILSSAFITVSMSAELGERIIGGEVVAVIAVMILFTSGIDVVLGVMKDPAFIKEVIRIWLQGRSKGP